MNMTSPLFANNKGTDHVKTDINLIAVQKTGREESKRTYVLLIVLFVLALAAAIIMPTQARNAARSKLENLEYQMNALTVTQEDLNEMTVAYQAINQQRVELAALRDSRADVLSYLDVMEKSLPAPGKLTSINIAGNTVEIAGNATDDAMIAAFCVKLRQSGMFSSVFLTNSTVEPTGTRFAVTATLPQSLNNTIQEAGKILTETNEKLQTLGDQMLDSMIDKAEGEEGAQ